MIINPYMFSLKKFTNFNTFIKVFTTEKYLIGITSSSVIEIFYLSLEHFYTINIMDLIINTIIENDLYVLTPSSLHVLKKNNNFKKNDIILNFDIIFDKIFSFKNKFLIANNKILCFYNKKFEFEHKINLKLEDILLINNLIYVLSDGKIYCFQYFFKLLIKKEIDFLVKHLHLSNNLSLKNRIVYYNNNFFIIYGLNSYYIYDNVLFLTNISNKKFKYEADLIEIEDEIDFISQCGKYVIYKDQIKFIEDFDKLERIDGKNIEIVKNVDLENVKNFKFRRGVYYSKPTLRSNNYFTLKKDILCTENYFIYCKGILNYYNYNNILVLIKKCTFIIYNIDTKVKYINQYQYNEIFLFSNKFVYFCFNSLYYILDLYTEKKYKYIKKDIEIIEQIKNHIIVCNNNIIRLYKINESKYTKIYSNENNKNNHYFDNNTFFSYYEKKDKIILGLENIIKMLTYEYKVIDTFQIDGIPLQIFPYNDYIFLNIQNKGIHIYKNKTLIIRDPIDRYIKYFYVFNDKIFINDQLKYLTILSLEFNVLGIIYINEYVVKFYIKNNNVYFMTEIGNVYKIKEVNKTENFTYFKNHIKFNFIVEI